MDIIENENVRPIFRQLAAWWKGRTSTDEDVISADTAYCRSTYGVNTDVSKIVKMHQHNINTLIKDKAQPRRQDDTFRDYRCVYSFPKDVVSYIDEILEPFKKNGYSIMNLSEKIDELKEDHVYLISWYKKTI